MRFAYMDETGNTGRRFDDRDQPIHMILTLVVDEARVTDLHEHIREVGRRHCPDDCEKAEFEFHGGDLFSGGVPFGTHSPGERVAIYDEVLRGIELVEAEIIVRGVHKAGLERRYPHPYHPHDVALMFTIESIERLARELDCNVLLVADEAKEVEDAALRDLVNIPRARHPVGLAARENRAGDRHDPLRPVSSQPRDPGRRLRRLHRSQNAQARGWDDRPQPLGGRGRSSLGEADRALSTDQPSLVSDLKKEGPRSREAPLKTCRPRAMPEAHCREPSLSQQDEGSSPGRCLAADRERIAAVAVPLPDPPIWAMQDVLDPVGTGQSTANKYGIPPVRIEVRRSLAIYLDHPTTAARNHVDVFVHCSPFQGHRPRR
jgi:hypothetical protein